MRRTILFLAIATALLVRVAGADQPTKPESTARGYLKITADRESASAMRQFVTPLLTTQSLLKKAISEVSQEAALEIYKVASVETTFDGKVATRTIVVKSFDERVPADKLLDALVEVLNSRLRDITQKDYDATAQRLNKENQRVEKLAADLRTGHEALMSMAAIHQVEIDPALGAQKRLRIETELLSLDVQLQGLKARQMVVERQIAELAKKVAQGEGADQAVLKELIKSVDARKKIVEYRQAAFTAGAVGGSVTDLEQAKDELAKAEVELAKYGRVAADKAGGGRIAQLKTRLDDAAIETAEIVAKRKVLQEQFEKARRYSGDVGMKQIELELLELEYRQRAEELVKLRAELRKVVPPVVTLIPLD